MPLARSKLTAQGQISVPAEVRRKLGIGPGSVIVWEELNDQIVVSRTGRFTPEDIHRALFPAGPPKRRGIAEMDDAIRRHIRRRHGRR